MDLNKSLRIHPRAFEVATGILFGGAIITYLCRLYIQLIYHRRFPPEDWVLLFAVLALIASTTLGYISFPKLVDVLPVTAGIPYGHFSFEELEAEARDSNAADTLWMFIIYPVKLAYLFFFRKLLSRVKHLGRYWWFVLAFTIAGFIASVIAVWQICPYTSISGLITKCPPPVESRRNIQVTIATSILDVASDMLIASIPVCLLWRVRISLRQKIGLGLTLCLSLVMAVFAVIRIGGVKFLNGTIDVLWYSFWQQNECNIAVCMVSMTSFRSFLVTSRERDEQRRGAGIGRRFRHRLAKMFPTIIRKERDTLHSSSLPYEMPRPSDQPMIESHDISVPPAALTGARTAIDRVGRTRVSPGGSMAQARSIHKSIYRP